MMHWSIRNQILFPFAGVVLLAVIAVTAVAASTAARQRDAQTLSQLRNLLVTLDQTSVPLNASVLEKMRGFSGAHFLAYDSSGRLQGSTLPQADRLPQLPERLPAGGGLETLANQPRLEVAGTQFYVARLDPRSDASVRRLYVLYPVDTWQRDRWVAALPPLLVGCGAVLLTAVVSGWLAQRFGRRIRKLQQQVAAIAAGDFSEIPVGSRVDEIQELVAAVNSMSAQLRAMQTTIQQAERERLLAQLAGGLAHQLRNAVAGARMALQLHQRRCTSAPQDQSLGVALRQLSLTETQVKGLLALGKAEHSPPRETDVNQLLDDVALLVQPACEHAAVNLDVWHAEGAVPVLAEPESLRAAVLNLATNAIEAAGSGGDVTLGARRVGPRVVLEVSDSGRGPAPVLASSLFDPFVTTKPEGVGLGLALARQVSIDHGGRISWKREQGRTLFQIELPAYVPGEAVTPVVAPADLEETVGSLRGADLQRED
ncbi:MAG: HAMP domain-containing histidine kinase [Planctomycetes bacterium]|nr:HAMP domain-containing histidine kinase [Planctomycetota bacterium]